MTNDINDQFLQNIPKVIYTNFQVNDDNVYIITNNDRKIQSFFRKLKFKIAKETKMKLDDYSSFVFLLIDGEKTIYQIGQLLVEKFGEQVKPVYERLITFLEYIKIEKKWIKYLD